jgi:cellobiose-specific phosphotransferase system component IIA
MALTRTEREQIQDSNLKLQSVSRALSQVDPRKIGDFADIQECIEDARKSLSDALKVHEEEIKKPQ